MGLVYTRETNGTLFYLEVSNTDVQALVFNSERPEPIPFPVEQVAAKQLFPEVGRSYEVFFSSFADLDDVVEVTPCRQVYPQSVAITGLILKYRNGSRRAVGHVRLDRLDKPVSIEDGMTLSFAIDHHGPHIKTLETFMGLPPPEEQEKLVCTMTGRLEWWFSERQCVLYFGDQTSPATRVDWPENVGCRSDFRNIISFNNEEGSSE